MKKIEFKREKDTFVIYFYGEIDNKACSEYKETIIKVINEYKYLDIVLDFSNVTFIDSSGIGLIIGRYNQMKNTNNELIIRGTNRRIDKLFEISGLWKIIKSEKKVIL